MNSLDSVCSRLAALHGKGRNLHIEAVRLLGELGEHVPFEVLVDLLDNDDEMVGQEVINALGERIPVEKLLALLDNKRIAIHAIEGVLGKLGSRAPVEHLLEHLYHENRQVRASAARVLIKLGVPFSLDP